MLRVPHHFTLFFAKILTKFGAETFPHSTNSIELDLNELRETKGSLILSVARDEKNFKTAISICSRISLSYPNLKQFLFATGFIDSNLCIKIPKNLSVREIKNEPYKDLLNWLKKLELKAIILIDSNSWPELFAECKRLNIDVFWINATRKKYFHPFSILSWLPRTFLKFSKNLNDHVLVYATDSDSRKFFLTLKQGLKVSENVGRFINEPVTLPNNMSSRLDKHFSTVNRVIWFAAGAYEHELETILKCQSALLDWIPNIYLLLLVKKGGNDKNLIDGKFSVRKSKNVILVNWEKDEIIESLKSSQITLLGGSLNKERNTIEVFDPMIPVAYSSAVVTGPNYGHHSQLISELVSYNGIKTVLQSPRSNEPNYNDLFKTVFETLKSNVLADTISNAWSITTNSPRISDEFIRELRTVIKE